MDMYAHNEKEKGLERAKTYLGELYGAGCHGILYHFQKIKRSNMGLRELKWVSTYEVRIYIFWES